MILRHPGSGSIFPQARASARQIVAVTFRHLSVTLVGLLLTSTALRAETKEGCGAAASDALVNALHRQAPTLRSDVLRLALHATLCAAKQGLVVRRDLLSVIDYSLPSTEPRLFVFNMASQRLLFRELVAHGKNSGENATTRFSNEPGSLETSLGLFVTDDTYSGHNGYSLRLRGLDTGFNDLAYDRAIVMHGAAYVSNSAAKALGRLGRSWGCPAVRKEVAQKVIDTLKGGAAIFAFYPDKEWLRQSRFLKDDAHDAASLVASVAATGGR